MCAMFAPAAGGKVQGESAPGRLGGATVAREQGWPKKAGAGRTPADPKNDQAGQRDIGEMAKEI